MVAGSNFSTEETSWASEKLSSFGECNFKVTCTRPMGQCSKILVSNPAGILPSIAGIAIWRCLTTTVTAIFLQVAQETSSCTNWF